MAESSQTTPVKAWLFTTTPYPDSLHQGIYDTPTTPPTPTSLIIKPHAVSLNPVDIQLINLPTNDIPSWTPLLPSSAGPKIAGRDFSGTVIAAGSSTSFHPGDAIVGINMAHPGTGFLAERVVLDISPSSGATVIAKPSHLSHVEAASLPCVYLTARTSIEKVTPYLPHPSSSPTSSSSSQNKVAILGGSSATGIYTLKLAKSHGWTVLTTCSHRNTDFVKSLGADIVIDYTTSPTAVFNGVKSFAPHAIIDCVGGTDTIGLAPYYVTIVGDKTSRSTMGGSALYWTRPRMVLRWLMGYLGLGCVYECIILERRKEWLEEIAGLNQEGKKGDVVIDSVFAFDRVKEAFERLDTGRARGKVVVKVVDDE